MAKTIITDELSFSDMQAFINISNLYEFDSFLSLQTAGKNLKLWMNRIFTKWLVENVIFTLYIPTPHALSGRWQAPAARFSDCCCPKAEGSTAALCHCSSITGHEWRAGSASEVAFEVFASAYYIKYSDFRKCRFCPPYLTMFKRSVCNKNLQKNTSWHDEQAPKFLGKSAYL